MKNKWIIVLIILLAITNQEVLAQGCSQCKMLAEQSTELDEASFGSNINKGILYLMAIPYILLFLLFRKKIFTFFRGLKNQ